MAKTSYHTNLLLAFHLDLIPAWVLARIPSSTRHDWKHRDPDRIASFGYDNEELTDAQKFLRSRWWPVVRRLMKINQILRTAIISQSNSREILEDVKDRIINFVSSKADFVDEKNKLLEYLGVKPGLFGYWSSRTHICFSSLLRYCRNRRPFQLTIKEVNRLKRYLKQDRFKCWPLISIYYKALDEDVLHIGRSTFYKYARLLGFFRRFRKRKRNYEGYRAKKPGEVLHADVTISSLINGQTIYIHVLIDNFSRKILRCIVSEIKSANITCGNIRSALLEFPDIFQEQVSFIVDAGSENKGEVDLFVAENPELIHKLVAQKDVNFSNSMVEATNNVIKNQYLRDLKFDCVDKLQEHLDSIVRDFNSERPHGQLFGLKPDQAFAGEHVNPFRFRDAIADARIIRLAENQDFDCSLCSAC